MIVDESQSKVKIAEVQHKLKDEEGFTDDQVAVVNNNMIFFKSIAEVKKRN